MTEMFKGISHPPEEMRFATTKLEESVTVSGTIQGLVAILRSPPKGVWVSGSEFWDVFRSD